MTNIEIIASRKICEAASQPPDSLLLRTKEADQLFVEHARIALPALLDDLVAARKARFRMAQIASEFAVRLDLPKCLDDEELLAEISAALEGKPAKCRPKQRRNQRLRKVAAMRTQEAVDIIYGLG